MDEIKVHVIKRKSKRFLYLKYTDPVTCKPIWRSSGTTRQKEAQRAAGIWESELNAGKATQTRRMAWDAFRDAYEQHVAATLSDNTFEKVVGLFNLIEETMKPDALQRITSRWVSQFQAEMLTQREQSTVESLCRHLRAALNWAQSQGMIATVPTIARLKRARSAKVMKGRPVTGEEFERMLTAVEKLPKKQHHGLKFLLRGLWLSGLRIGEAMSLTWDRWADGIRVDADGLYVKLLIPAEAEKGGKDRTYPVTPDFAEFLLSVPPSERTGRVFTVIGKRGITVRPDTVSKILVRIGESAGVKVDERKKRTTEGVEVVPVYASAHDLRRAFGYRWSRKVSAMVLKELMRHENVSTTEKYYVDVNADQTAAMLAEICGLGAPLGAPPNDDGQSADADSQQAAENTGVTQKPS